MATLIVEQIGELETILLEEASGSNGNYKIIKYRNTITMSLTVTEKLYNLLHN